MYLTDEILDKLNARGSKKAGSRKADAGEKVTLPDIMVRSFAELKELAGDALTWDEKNFLYQQAQKELKKNRMAESRILSRANPQLTNAVSLGIRQSSMLRSYDDLFPQRAGRFVQPGSVASMFSPAGYLTELYREARGLHADTSQYHLDTRRPDLASLSLSQTNMDDELSTLSLSNELLLNNIQSQEKRDHDGVMAKLATYRQTGATPYNRPYEAVRQSILLQDPAFAAFKNNPAVAAKMDAASLLGIQFDISPELHSILTEEISADNVDELIRKNFGNIDTTAFQNLSYIGHWYGLSQKELESILGIMYASSNADPDKQYYRNDQLVSLIKNGDNLKATLIKRDYSYISGNSTWVEIIPLENDTYRINVSFDTTSSDYDTLWIGSSRTGSYSHDIVEEKIEGGVELNKVYTYTHELTADEKGIFLWIGFYNDNEGRYSHRAVVNFTVVQYDFNIFLLKLNKLIRLFKATGITPSDIITVIESSNNDLTITEDVLRQLFWANYYAQRYGIDFSAAIVLAGANISQTAHSGKDSAFTRLFNTPPLNNQMFSADGTVIKLLPADMTDTFRTGVMKHAFGVSDTELYTLWSLTRGSSTPGDFTCTTDNLSGLYRTKLLADVNGLSVTELAALLSVSTYAARAIDALSGAELAGLISAVSQYTGWLKDMNWTVSDLYLMLTDRFSTTLTADIENLIATLSSGLASQDLSKAGEAALISAAAPFVAAATGLDSADTAGAVLQWLSQLKPQELTVADFLALADNDSRTDAQTSSLVAYCQVMGQLILFVRMAGLTPTELSWGVAHPTIITEKGTVLSHDIGTLYDLTQLHALLARCGTYATEILTSLSGKGDTEKNNLAIKTVATALALDEQALTQALNLCSSYTYFYHWTGLRDTLQWLDMATTLGITPANVAALVELTPATSYDDWDAMSHVLQAGLNTQQTAQLEASLDESLSAAVSAYVIKNISPSWVTDRDKLYDWLLLDNQISGQVRTTRIAEAIASVQLYVNRALSGLEMGVDNSVASRQFFTDWDMYNKRYSTWNGVSQLVYYPENYVDPTVRIGQTGMMNEMLQSLSQTQLNKDTVEDSIMRYLTSFDEVANLKTVNGYHDNHDVDTGITWFIGCSQGNASKYYWRSVEHSKFIDGKFSANAWEEWNEISCPINPINSLVRPVLWNSRLHVVWIERKQQGEDEKNNPIVKWLLKVAHINYDGSWKTLNDIDITSYFQGETGTDSFYCAGFNYSDDLCVAFYPKKDNADNYNEESISIILIESDYTTLALEKDSIKFLLKKINNNLDVTNTKKICSEINSDFSFHTRIIYDDPNDIFKVNIVMEDILCNDTAEGHTYLSISPRIDVSMTVDLSDKIKLLLSKCVTDGAVYQYSDERNKLLPARDRDTYIDAAILVKTGDNLKAYFLVYDEIQGYLTQIDHMNSSVARINHPLSFRESVDDFTYILGFDCGNDSLENIDKCSFEIGNSVIYQFQTNGNGYFGGFKNFACFSPSSVIFSIDSPDKLKTRFSADSFCSSTPSFNLGVMSYSFFPVSLDLTDYINDQGKADITLAAQMTDLRRNTATQRIDLNVKKIVSSDETIQLHTTEEGAQYIQFKVYRTRLNTLFAKNLISRATQGVDRILQMDTQKLQEPKLGEGVYVKIQMKPYDKATNGTSGEFEIVMRDVFKQEDRYILSSGTLDANQPVSVNFFLPRVAGAYGNADHLYFGANYQNGDTNSILIQKDENNNWHVDPTNNGGTFRGLLSVSLLNGQDSEPMDFGGANALYFWEMFYYVPMMVFKRLLSESRYTDAASWLQYIWNPAGYFVDGEKQNYTWNVRPLEEDTSWHADPLDSVDPDAVAQADPLHYKVATFMAYLDLLIARGDAAYRQLERDTLNEAKMWYVQALDVLGDEPWLSHGTDWASPRLSDAADETAQVNMHEALMAVRQQVTAGELRTANSLTGLFLPQQNEKLAGYWQTLAQRLYNLRHNLSIDGNPLSLAIYAKPADPAALLSAAVMSSQGGRDLPAAVMPLYRFPVIVESARSMVGQLIQFGSTLLGITERQDAEALSELLQTQGAELVLQSITLQKSTISEIDADKAALEESLSGAQSRLDSYAALYEEDVNTGETQAMNLLLTSSSLAIGGQGFHTAAGGLDLAPNIFGLADGGSRWGAAFSAMAGIADLGALATQASADRLSQSEMYRRRREEWEIQRNAAQSEVSQINAQLDALSVRREGAVLQKAYLETQQAQTQAQMTFLQNKFTSKALYNWLRGKLAAIYYQFYDLTVSRCLMAEKAYQWALGNETSFIRPGAWQGTYAGLMAGEKLMLNLAQMEQDYLQKDQRKKEVTRTICLSEVYAGLTDKDSKGNSLSFNLSDQVVALVTAGSGSSGTDANGLSMTSDKQLQARLTLSVLNIGDDYPVSLGNTRRIKQISVTLPALVGPYQDVRAALSYSDPKGLAKGCDALAVSHGMNDSGQFQLDFNDGRWLPFEGIPVDSSGVLTLSFPGADDKQKDLLLSLADIILHIRYTIAS
ncbi:neuraminidase-like domain-containing protein [Pantoea sp. AS142]|uniref:Tc toxin subunit A-related protein n=1 Tax=Pantoea sp. AS142 TaxID=3081292 RepID=UPI00301925EB